MSGATEVSRNGLLQIIQQEAFVPVAYHDGFKDKAKTIQLWSKGFGDNTAKPGEQVTLKEAFAHFKVIIDDFTKVVLKTIKVPLLQHQLDGAVSLRFQGGNKKLRPLAYLMNEGFVVTAGDLFLDPKMATNQHDEFFPGLAKRRQREHDIFVDGKYGDIGWIWKYTGNPKLGVRVRYEVQPGDL